MITPSNLLSVRNGKEVWKRLSTGHFFSTQPASRKTRMMKGHYVGALIDLLVETGVDRAQFLQLCGVRESELTSDNLIDQERVYRVTELTV